MINPGQLKLELYCRGLKLDDEVDLGNVREILRTRGGLGSGIDLILPKDVWVNAPVLEGFANNSPYVLTSNGKTYRITKEGEDVAKVRVLETPKFYDKKTSDGIEMRKIGVMQGGYFAVYPAGLCGFWPIGLNCRFCSSGLNVGKTELPKKSVSQVVEAAKAAFDEGVAEFIHLNIGFMDTPDRGIKFLEPYVKALKKEIDTLIGIQSVPPKDKKWIEHAYAMGVDSMSFNFELMDPKRFAEVCPGKNKLVTQKHFLDMLEYAAGIFPSGTAAGEIIAGLETPEWTMRGIDAITQRGGVPIVCIFRPLKGTALENVLPPEPEDVAPVFAHMYKQCKKHKIRMSWVKHVPLVIMPIEGRYFTGEKLSIKDKIAQKVVRTSKGSKLVRKMTRRVRKKTVKKKGLQLM